MNLELLSGATEILSEETRWVDCAGFCDKDLDRGRKTMEESEDFDKEKAV